MNGSKSQINFILVNKKLKNSIKKRGGFSNTGSDHHLVTKKIKLNLWTGKTPKPDKNWLAKFER